MSPEPIPRILIADDQPDVVEALRILLKSEGYQAEAATSPAGIIKTLEDRDFDLLLMDLNYTRDTTSGQEGLDLLSRIQLLDSGLPVVVMTAWSSVELAVEAMRRGARDFVQKPWENARLLTILHTQIELSRALRRGRRLEAQNRLLCSEPGPSLIAESASMTPVLELIARVGPSDANVLITGEHGTGKEVVARALHAVSLRAGLEHDPGENHGFAAFELQLAREGDAPFHLEVVADAFPVLEGTVLLPDHGRQSGQTAVGLQILFRDG